MHSGVEAVQFKTDIVLTFSIAQMFIFIKLGLNYDLIVNSNQTSQDMSRLDGPRAQSFIRQQYFNFEDFVSEILVE